MRFKPGVPQDNPDPKILEAREIYDELLSFYFSQGEGIITSTQDGKHKIGSKHYTIPRQGEDWRFPNLFRQFVWDLTEKLDKIGLEVILEKDHFHVETK